MRHDNRASIKWKVVYISATAITIAGSGIALTSGAATAATCKTTVTHHHSVTAKGTVSDYTMTKQSCGTGNYTETENGTTQSATGAHAAFTWRKVDVNGCWTKVESRVSTSAKGTVTDTTTTSGNC